MSSYADLFVKDYSKKKLIQYLAAGQTNLIIFPHGIGDCVMFMPLYNRLKQLYPKVTFNLQLNKGQDIFQQKTTDTYDIAFLLHFPDAAFSPAYTGRCKPQLCCDLQLGIPYQGSLQFTWKPQVRSGLKLKQNTIGVAFQSTCNPKRGLSQDKAFIVWEAIEKAGYTPCQIHFQHVLRNSKNTRYSFIDYSMRDQEANIPNLVTAIDQCKMFFGANTGSFCMSVAMHPQTTFGLHTVFPWCPNFQTKHPVPQIMTQDITENNIVQLIKDTLTNKSK